MRELLGQGQCLVTALEGLLRIAELPEGPGEIGETPYPEVSAIAEGQMVVLLAIIERYALLEVHAGLAHFSKHVYGDPQRMVSDQEECRIVVMLG
jgi:hypothetical protein